MGTQLKIDSEQPGVVSETGVIADSTASQKQSAEQTKNVQSVIPNLKLLLSLRNLGYDLPAAFAEYIDNSLDANSKHISICFDLAKHRIYITDDGLGMSKEVLSEGMTLASDGKKDKGVDLGCFGMGMKTAMLSFARKMTVITKQKTSAHITSIMDIDDMIANSSWDIPLRFSNTSEAREFNSFVKNREQGTLIILDKIDSTLNLKKVFEEIKKPLGEIYRKFLIGDLVIELTIIGQKSTYLSPVDPLSLTGFEKEIELIHDEEHEVKFTYFNGEKRTENVRIKAVLMPKLADGKDNKLNQATQGIYVLRNNRQLFAASTLGLFKKHNQKNRFRAEINFSARLDDVLALTFNKRSAANLMKVDDSFDVVNAAQQSIMDQLRPIILSLVNEAERKSKLDESADLAKNENTSQAEDKKIIDSINNNYSNRLPAVEVIEKEELITNKPVEPVIPPANDLLYTEKEKQDILKHAYELKYQVMGENGPIYTSVYHGFGKKVTIIWNTSHPFYHEYSKMAMDVKNLFIKFIAGYVRSEAQRSGYPDAADMFKDYHMDAGRFVRMMFS